MLQQQLFIDHEEQMEFFLLIQKEVGLEKALLAWMLTPVGRKY